MPSWLGPVVIVIANSCFLRAAFLAVSISHLALVFGSTSSVMKIHLKKIVTGSIIRAEKRPIMSFWTMEAAASPQKNPFTIMLPMSMQKSTVKRRGRV